MDPHGRAMDMEPYAGRLCHVTRPAVSLCLDLATRGGSDTLPRWCIRPAPVTNLKDAACGVDLGAAFANTARARRACQDDEGRFVLRRPTSGTAGTRRGCRDADNAFPLRPSAAKLARRPTRGGGARPVPEAHGKGQTPASPHGTAPRVRSDAGAVAPRISGATRPAGAGVFSPADAGVRARCAVRRPGRCPDGSG